MKMMKILYTGLAFAFLFSSQSHAATYTYEDNWINWPGYDSSLGDENGSPKIDNMVVDISDNDILQSVKIYLHDSTFRPLYDSLFISTSGEWDSWNYFVHDGGVDNTGYTTGTPASDGLWEVSNPDDYDYTFVTNTHYRDDNPNGIDANSLNPVAINSTFEADLVTEADAGIDFGTSISALRYFRRRRSGSLHLL